MSVALQNRIRQWINGVEVVEATDVDIQAPKPVGAKFGAAGLIGVFKGQAMCRIQLTFAQPAQKAQFEAFALTQDDPDSGFVYVFTKGLSRFQVNPCVSGDAGMRGNFESGDTSVTLTLMGAPARQIS